VPTFTLKLKAFGIVGSWHIVSRFFKEGICSWLDVVYDFPEKNLIFMNLNKMVSLLNWLSLVIVNIVWCSIHSLCKQEINHIFMLMHYRKDVVSLPDGLFADVLLIWQEVCWSNLTNSIIFEKRALYSTIPWYRLGSGSQFVCKG